MQSNTYIRIIPLSIILSEANALIRKSQYRKAYKFLNKPFQEPKTYFRDKTQLPIYIQISRRLTYITIKIINNYISKFQEKSHKIKILLVRSFDAIESWLKFLINYENDLASQKQSNSSIRISSRRELRICHSPKRKQSLKKFFIPSQASLGEIDSPLIHVNEIEDDQLKLQKSDKWLQYQKYDLLHYLQKLLKNFYIFLKLRKDTALIPIVLQKLLVFNEFIKSRNLIRTQKLIQITSQSLTLIGNAYYELGSMSQAIPFYYESLMLSLRIGVFPLLDDKEKQKFHVEDTKFHENLVSNLQIAIVALDHLSQASEYISDYEMALNALSFSEFLCSFLYYLRIGKELTSYILARHEYVFNHYGDFLYEKWELLKLTEIIYGFKRGFSDNKIQFYEKKSLSEQLQENIYHKFNYEKQKQFIAIHTQEESQNQNDFFSRRVLSPFQQKVRLMLKVDSPPASPKLSSHENANNTTVQSTKLAISKNASMTDLIQLDLRPSSGLPSLSLTHQRLFSPISQNSQKSIKGFNNKKQLKFKRFRNEKTNYITELIRMQNENLSDKLDLEWNEREKDNDQNIPEEVRKELQKQNRIDQDKLHTLDEAMKQMIDEKMTSQLKLVNYDKAVSDCQRLYKSHRDLKKEVPLTRGILGFRKEYGNGVAIIPESVEDV